MIAYVMVDPGHAFMTPLDENASWFEKNLGLLIGVVGFTFITIGGTGAVNAMLEKKKAAPCDGRTLKRTAPNTLLLWRESLSEENAMKPGEFKQFPKKGSDKYSKVDGRYRKKLRECFQSK